MRFLPCFIIIVFVFLSCNDQYKPETETPTVEETQKIIRVDELFVSETEKDEDGADVTVFKTNDKKYWGYEGITLWTVWGEAQDVFTSRTVKMAKASGYSYGGYGMVFCQGEYAVNGKSVLAMLVVMINNEGQYIIGKTHDGIFNDFGWWKTSSHINKGTGALNEILINYDETDNEFCLTINGYETERFKDEAEPILRKGRNGYIVVITPFDNFPYSVVDVYFKEER